jgi:hypothetical protein
MINNAWMGQGRMVVGIVAGLMIGAVPGSSSWAQPGIQQTLTSGLQGWQARFERMFRRPPPLPVRRGGPRGEVCLLSPGTGGSESGLLDNQVVLMWRGPVTKVAVQQVGIQKVLWSRAVGGQPVNGPPVNGLPVSGLNVIRYGGPVLVSGTDYEWQIFGADGSSPQQFQRFRVMDAADRAPITQDWLRKETMLRAAGASPMDWGQARVEFLLERGLTMDLYQSLFLAAHRGWLDQEGRAIVSDIVQEVCGTRE